MALTTKFLCCNVANAFGNDLLFENISYLKLLKSLL